MTVKRELLNANITHVSYVNKGANQKKFFLTKSEDQPTFEKQVKIFTKENDAEKLVYGVVYSPDETDAHGDFMKAEEIEKSAHQFLKDARNIDTQHDFVSGAGDVVESYVAPSDILIGTDTITKGSWVLVTKATDEIWESIQKGDITGYSMAGTAEVIELEKAEEKQMKSFFQTMKAFFTPIAVEKGDVQDRFYEGKKKREFFDAFNIFESYFYDAVWSGEINKIKEHALDLAELMTDIANSPDIMKALGNIEKSKEVITVKKEDFQALLKEEMKSIVEKVEALEKAQAPVVADPVVPADVQKADDEPVEKEDLIKAFKEVLKEELAPISDRIDKVEKARGISKKAEEEIEKTEVPVVSVFESLFRTN